MKYQVRVLRNAMKEMIELLNITIKVLSDDNSCALLLESSSEATETSSVFGDFIILNIKPSNSPISSNILFKIISFKFN
jgi:hypothetical protein